ncbi:MAG: hypothetical protein KDA31_11970 [Phycisphaerales bacterium]|nr:hypothetical protein [Phycisphaerales bacterium]MCB9836648.1 hypothetical protein [Phycisphaera sp.]
MPKTPPRSLGPTGWAVYLGCSWTWCIGMFLPALLIRDLGFWGYVVFAVPNVVGAAAMGWVLKSPESSRRLVGDHRPAAVMFSRVTIFFHEFWIAWLFGFAAFTLGWSNWNPIIVVAIAALLMTAQSFGEGDKSLHVQAIVVWIVSALLLLVLVIKQPLEPTPSEQLPAVPFSKDVLWLAPASIFGFLFCPYLDLTFHRARRSSPTPSASRVAFGLGFGVFFFSMIVLTVLYAGPIAVLTDRDPDTFARNTIPIVGLLLAAHFLTQMLFTTGVHRREFLPNERTRPGLFAWHQFVTIMVVCLGLLAGIRPEWPATITNWFDMTSGEIIYRAFLTFYGLIFPTYVYLNVWNVRGRCLRTRTQRSTLVTIIAIVLASPFFFMGFFVRDERYIPAGVAILLAAKFFTGSEDRPRPLAQPA